jgi:hypothetical protein
MNNTAKLKQKLEFKQQKAEKDSTSVEQEIESQRLVLANEEIFAGIASADNAILIIEYCEINDEEGNSAEPENDPGMA